MNNQLFISFLLAIGVGRPLLRMQYTAGNADMVHLSSAGAAMGFVNFIGSIGALSFPAIFGHLLDETQSFVCPFTFIAGMALLAFTCVLVWRPA